jgi:hypothetical protein
MSKSYSPENLSPFEAQLASLLPGTAGLNRDQIMFQAGQSDARRQHLQSLRRWQTLSAVLLAATAAQWSLAPWGNSPTSSNQLVSQRDEAMPSQRDMSSSLPGGSREDVAQGVGGQTPEENGAIDVERDRSRSVGLSAPSTLVREGDVLREVDAEATTRDPRTPGSGLTVGSWPTLARNEPSTFSPVASGFLSPPQTSRELLVELSRY